MASSPLGLLSKMTSEMLDKGPLTSRAERLVWEIVKVFEVDSCIIRTLEDDGNLKLLAAVGVEGMTIAPLIPAFYGISRGILEDRAPAVIEDAATHPLTSLLYAKGKNVPGRFVFESYAGAPMIGANGPVGIIGIYSCRDRRKFGQDNVDFLQVVANHFGVMVENHRLHETLEKRVEERTAELAKARDAANAASRAKSDFLASMSHELRTPLNSIVGFGQVLEGTDLDPRQREAVGCILQSSRLLVEIINDILDYTQLEAGRLPIHTRSFNPSETLRATFDLLRGQAEAKGLHYTFKSSEAVAREVHGDPVRISQVLLHLLSNAVKFTEKGSVSLKASLEKAKVGKRPLLTIAVEDTGLGISEVAREAVFAPFTKGEHTSHLGAQGTGLGLSLVDRLTKALGGSVDIRSTMGVGTTFTAYFPVELLLAPRDQATPSPAQPGLGGMRLLVVEDNPTNRLVLRRLLERLGVVNVLEANNGQEALELLEDSEVDLVLMDVHMPVMDGLECTAQIRTRSWVAREIPIVAVTAGSKGNVRERCQQVGMNGLLSKPVEIASLKETLLRYVTQA